MEIDIPACDVTFCPGLMWFQHAISESIARFILNLKYTTTL